MNNEYGMIEPVNEAKLNASDKAYYKALDAIREPDLSNVAALLDKVRKLSPRLAGELDSAINHATTEAQRLGFRAARRK